MRVAPELLPLVAAVAADPVVADPAEARVRDATAAAALAGGVSLGAPPSVLWEDRVADGVPVRIYRPEQATGVGLVYAHGGGWMTGSVETVHGMAGATAADSGATVVSVDYRLIPEHPFPAGLDDVVTAFRWTQLHADELGLDADRIAIGGASAGGNLAAAASVRLRAKGFGTPALQLLEAAALSLRRGPTWDEARRDLPTLAVMLENALAAYVAAGADMDDPEAAPLVSASVDGFPPAVLLAGEADPLRADTLAYAGRLIEAGVACELHLFPGIVHGTENFVGVLPQARHWHRVRCRVLRELAARGHDEEG